MQLSCDICNRTFDVDPRRIEEFAAAKCVCGARLPLKQATTQERAGPQRLGKYVLLQRIAVGGMGEIFYGKIGGVEGFEREVAIKKMLPHLSADRAFIDQMIKEAKLTVQLNHPNIVQVYDLAKEGSEYYIAMEYVPGVTVGQLLERCSRSKTHLPFEVAVHITMQTLQGLAYAHDLRNAEGELMQILHRDITPQNIMVTRNAWVKITDFGIAKARNEISTTSPGMIKGKLGYIAPEQLTGGQEADQRIDLFCAAIVLWESLATRRLFKGVDEIDTFRMISECAIPPLSKYRDDVPPEIESALRGGLTRLPDNRYKSADEFYDALNASIFPNTADEYAAIAKRYFNENSEYFDSVERMGQLEVTDDLTVEMTDTTSEEQMIDIIEVTSVRRLPGAGQSFVPIAAAFVFVAVLVAVLAVVMRDDIKAWLNPLDPLTLEEVELAVNGERSRVLTCYEKADEAFRNLPSLTARLTVPSTGSVAKAELTPPVEKLGEVGPCVTDVLTGLQFRPHRDPIFNAEVTLPEPKLAPVRPKVSGNNKGSSGKKQVKKTKKTDKPAIKSQITAAVQGVSGSVAACADVFATLPTPPKKLIVTVSATAAGAVQTVEVAPPPGSDAAEKCLVRAVKKMKLPARDSGYKFSFDLSLK